MNKDLIRTTSSQRGFTYSYYYQPPSNSKPTILFLHGFPSTHRDWAAQITAVSNKGYGVIAPDLLGYGDTSAPEDVEQYKLLDMAQDVVDILNDLDISKVIGVSHDWGSGILSRLLDAYIDRFYGAAFLAVGYIPPQPNFDYKKHLAMLKALVGHDVFGYWEFFASDDAAALSEKNIDSLYSLLFPNDPLVWKTDMAPLGKAREWIEANKQLPRAHFWTAEAEKAHKQALLQNGFRGPYNWYKVHVTGINNAAEATIPTEAYHIQIPTFFGGATQDYICLTVLAKAAMTETCSNVVTKDFDTSHWIMMEASDELNEVLTQFFITCK
ncbi:Alpha/Beta hydrolase protein [Lentinula aciculospora]|uniref:Alpha/Beta hydrolase protein n=1 Tax=Lentinula aciculospora TaxID=153920 RepID=A0A9W9AKB7_9AGAR|nr:Alpha/Beta hydrolase protein [Lentinula aciculospora]